MLTAGEKQQVIDHAVEAVGLCLDAFQLFTFTVAAAQ